MMRLAYSRLLFRRAALGDVGDRAEKTDDDAGLVYLGNGLENQVAILARLGVDTKLDGREGLVVAPLPRRAHPSSVVGMHGGKPALPLGLG